jgi:SAM-dependent methyltransferase
MDPQFRRLLRAASDPFRRAGIYPWQFASWKLRLDPVFITLLRRGCLPDRGRLLDVGCGQGVLLALLAAAREEYRHGRWPEGWPAPPLHLELWGIEQRPDRARIASRALQDGARVEKRDVRDFDIPPCSVVTALDVLLYLSREEQQRLLEKVAGALEPGGVLLLREADAGRGFAYRLTRWSAKLSGMGRGAIWPALHCR